MSKIRRILVAACLVVAVASVAGCGSSSHQSAGHPENSTYQDARQLMKRAGFKIGSGYPKLDASWPARIRKHCTAMLMGDDRDNNTNMVQTWVCRSPAHAKALEAGLNSEPGTVITSTGSKKGAARYSVRQNLIFFVVAVNQATADRLTNALQTS